LSAIDGTSRPTNVHIDDFRRSYSAYPYGTEMFE
jgi:hypothetical protein